MHGMKLLELARLLGLSQSAIAAHFGINRSQVHRWAQGERTIPPAHLAPLLRLIYHAGQRYLDSGQADVWDVEPAVPPQRGLAGVQVSPPLRPQLEQLLSDILVENLELCGQGPSASIQALGEALGPYFAMDPATRRKPANAMELFRLSTELAARAEMLVCLEPFFELFMPATEEEEGSCRP